MMFNEEGQPQGYKYPKPSIAGGFVRSDSPPPPAPLSQKNADKIRDALSTKTKAAGKKRR